MFHLTLIADDKNPPRVYINGKEEIVPPLVVIDKDRVEILLDRPQPKPEDK